MNRFARMDRAHVWHPFTQMQDWVKTQPIVIRRGRGAVLEDSEGKKYLDANSSIWTNLHGHRRRELDAALRRQLGRIAHSSALGLANQPASLLAAALVRLARGGRPRARGRGGRLQKVFFSDDGSTAMEVALKLSYEFHRRRGIRRPRFLSVKGAYHGDTIGAASVGHIDLFHRRYSGLLFPSDSVMAPYCYRCPYNRAAPERADAREYRRCRWECVDQVAAAVAGRRRGEPYAAMVVEPLMQGAAGMIPQPRGWLKRVGTVLRQAGTQLIADEVMTGFGRTGTLFAYEQEGVVPDFLVLAKGLTGGYLPMAATLTTQEVFHAFLGEYDEFKAFFHGHSYTANQLGAATAMASLSLLERTRGARRLLERQMRSQLASLWKLPNVGDIRQTGLIAGIELVKDWRTRQGYPLAERAGIRVCAAMARRGVLTRPIGNVIVLMPPYCTRPKQLEKMVSELQRAIQSVLQPPNS